MRLGRWGVLVLGIAAAACASTIGPVVPSVEVLVVLDSLDDTLRIIPVDTPDVVHKMVLSLPPIAVFAKNSLALNGQTAAVGLDRYVLFYDLASHQQLCPDATLDALGVIRSLAFSDKGLVYAAAPTANSALYFDPAGCGTGGSVSGVRGGPRAFASVRSTIFAVTGTPNPPSWLTANLNETPSTPLAALDSIPLSGPGAAVAAIAGSDGFLYVLNAGTGIPNARLSQVNPVSRAELNVIPGFGTLPQYLATDGADHIYVASAVEGLMVYNLRTNQVERDANAAIPLTGGARGLVVDDLGRIYALIAGGCTAGAQAGSVQVFGADLVTRHGAAVGRCPVAIGVTDVPATLYHFTN